ncbi:glycosyltransferase [Lichenibacterium ramalinae]|jgi:glycosyltransferase involved in cell wall biosynthesis|uniref:Glycosyltransferase n=2 Tax=Lichenibacterium ramalinae TaxID=2316527 RepID=A0A4Q2RF57_9HYPH|nr:glycosyltransferase [Lichenibacterium ramalinae]
MADMKIVHYLNHAHTANGHVAVAVDLACEQARTGHDVHFVSGRCDFRPVLASHGVTFHEVREAEGAFRVLQMAQDLHPIVRRLRPDVINAHMVAAALAAKLVQILSPFGLVTTIHNAFDRQSSLMRVGDRAIAVSEAVRLQMMSRGIPERKLRVVRNGTIGGGRRSHYPTDIVKLEHPAVATVAGLHDRKGISDLILAFEKVFQNRSDAHLYIVGEGPRRDAYESLAARQKSAAHIHFTGHLDDPRSVLASTDIFALASLQDPFPLVLGEARQMGCAIVATRVDGIPEALWHGAKGMLVPPADPDSLAAALLDLIDDEPKRHALAAAAAADTDDITVERMNRDTMDVYDEILPRGRLATSSAMS